MCCIILLKVLQAHYLEAPMIDYKAAELQSSCLSGTDVPGYVECFASRAA